MEKGKESFNLYLKSLNFVDSCFLYLYYPPITCNHIIGSIQECPSTLLIFPLYYSTRYCLGTWDCNVRTNHISYFLHKRHNWTQLCWLVCNRCLVYRSRFHCFSGSEYSFNHGALCYFSQCRVFSKHHLLTAHRLAHLLISPSLYIHVEMFMNKECWEPHLHAEQKKKGQIVAALRSWNVATWRGGLGW